MTQWPHRAPSAACGATSASAPPAAPRGALESLDADDVILGHALDTPGGRTSHA